MNEVDSTGLRPNDNDAVLSRLKAHVAENVQLEAQSTEAMRYADEWWSAKSAITMCSMVLAFGLIAIAISSALALRKIEKDTILKVVVIPMAVMLAVFLVVAGYSDSQIAPAMGLLGTIVGYVLGASSPASSKGQQPVAQPGSDGDI